MQVDHPPRASARFHAWIHQRAQADGFSLDAAQEHAIARFDRLYADLIRLERRESSLIGRFTAPRTVFGLYVWGGVGRGKSFLMDSFYEFAPVKRKQRVHFHRFMQSIHHELHRKQGQADPLAAIARDLAREARLLCLDEFHITDITDAMMMKRLLEALFEQGLVLVTTSNFEPDALYMHGLQRSQFLPAINAIKENLEVLNVDGGVDYRLREIEKAGVYHVETDADTALERTFMSIARHEGMGPDELEIEGRTILARRHASGIAWFDFGELCDGPRGKADYIELARRYHTIILSDVPCFRANNADVLRRFVWLIDEFYDRRVKLIISARVPPDHLVSNGGQDGDPFQANLNASLNERLVSRLTEMQTQDYLSQPHLP